MCRVLFAGCLTWFGLVACTSAGEPVLCGPSPCGPAPCPYATPCWSPGTFQYSRWTKACESYPTQWRQSLPPPPCPVRHCATCIEIIEGQPVQAELLPMPRVEVMK